MGIKSPSVHEEIYDIFFSFPLSKYSPNSKGEVLPRWREKCRANKYCKREEKEGSERAGMATRNHATDARTSWQREVGERAGKLHPCVFSAITAAISRLISVKGWDDRTSGRVPSLA